MRPWPGQMEARLKAAGYDNFGDGDAVLQAMFESKLMDPREPDALASIKWLAEQGHKSAKDALCNFATAILEDGAANLPTSIRSYLINILNGRVSPHPENTRTDVIRNMLRDIGMGAMVKVAVARWKLPMLNSSASRHSAAWFVAKVMTDYAHKHEPPKHELELTERQVRRVVQTYSRGIGKRLSDFLLTGADHTIADDSSKWYAT